MRNWRGSIRGAALAAAFALLAGQALAGDGVLISPKQARDQFLAQNQGAALHEEQGRLTRIYGRAFSAGESPLASVETFLGNHAPVMGVSSADLAPEAWDSGGSHLVGLVSDEKGELKFTLARYAQYRDGVRVFRADTRLLVRNEAGFPLVLVSNTLRPMGEFHVDAGAAGAIDVERAIADVELRFPHLRGGVVSPAEVVVWAGVDHDVATPRLALTFEVTVGRGGDENYAKVLIVADATTGTTLWSESLIHNIDITGRTSGQATSANRAAECDPEVDTALPYVRLVSGASTAYADASGNYVLSNAGAVPVSVTASLAGRYFQVTGGATLTQSVTPPGPWDPVFNALNTDENLRAQVNAYLYANRTRDMIVANSPNYPGIWNDLTFTINTGVSGTCNAFYDGSSINFYNSGGSCNNSAFFDIVMHEYGHHMVATAGSGQGAYGEGYGDIMGVVYAEQSVLALGFYQNQCNSGIRNANNTCQYSAAGCSSCGSEIHACGQLIAGCVWSMRGALIAAGTPNYLSILQSVAINTVPLHGATSLINSDICIDYYTIDDNDANINNGTPHAAQISAGFNAHGLGVALPALSIEFPTGIPGDITPNQTFSIPVDINPAAGTLVPGTATVSYRIDGGSITTTALTPLGANHFRAEFPTPLCLDRVEYAFSARASDGTTVTSPAGVFPAVSYASSARLGVPFLTRFDDNGQANLGWTVTSTATDGPWDRGVPAGGGVRGDPSNDGDGSGACWLTDNLAGNSDVDGGNTILTSPRMDASGGEAAFIAYWRWYSNNFGASPETDIFVVQISGTDGVTWQNLETVGPSGPEVRGGWNRKEFQIPAALATANFRVRFNAADAEPGSVVEAGIDGVRLTVATCPADCPADFNGDGTLDFFDFDDFVLCFEGTSCPAGETADYNNDGSVDFFDYDDFVAAFETGC